MHQNGPVPDIHSHNIMILSLAKVGKFDDAKTYIENMTSKGLEPNVVSCNTVLTVGAELGDISRTLGFLEVKCVTDDGNPVQIGIE